MQAGDLETSQACSGQPCGEKNNRVLLAFDVKEEWYQLRCEEINQVLLAHDLKEMVLGCVA